MRATGSSEIIRRVSYFDWLRAWIRHRRKALQYRARVFTLRSSSVKAASIQGAEKILFARGDRLGDWMNSLPFLVRLRAAGRQVVLVVREEPVRVFLSNLGFKSIGQAQDLNGWRPDLVLTGESARHLRSPRHPDRWAFLERLMRMSGQAPMVSPCVWRSEAGPVFPGSYAPPGKQITATSLTDSLGDWLELPPAAGCRPLAGYRQKADRQIVFNLSAGRPGERGRRFLPISFWIELRRILEAESVVAVSQPGDEDRVEEFRQGCLRDNLSCSVARARTSLHDLASWLGQRGILITPETGLCHLAREIELPTIVMTPRRLMPFWYQPGSRLKVICYQNHIGEVDPSLVVRALRLRQRKRIL